MDPELYGYSEKTAKEAASQVLTVNIRVTADNGRTGVYQLYSCLYCMVGIVKCIDQLYIDQLEMH